jgi:hypothetical protein
VLVRISTDWITGFNHNGWEFRTRNGIKVGVKADKEELKEIVQSSKIELGTMCINRTSELNYMKEPKNTFLNTSSQKNFITFLGIRKHFKLC